MKSFAMSAVILVGFAASALGQSASSKIAPSKGWHNNLDSARAQARTTGKPMMVIFRCDP